jgi:hypothetical protein
MQTGGGGRSVHLQRMPGAWSPGMRLCAATRVKSLATADPLIPLFIFSKIVAASLMALSMKKSLPGSASMNPTRPVK